jgi:peptide deformylase
MIITDPSLLKQKCSDATLEEANEIILKLEEELENSGKLGNPGIGLAAPQIGIYKNVAIIRVDEFRINLVNARIEKQYDQFIFEGEGCLSFPGRVEKTLRYNEIVVSNSVEPHRFTATGLLAVVILHELDHTEGITLDETAIKQPEIKQAKNKLRPNDLCYCGSGKKLKKCCKK